MIPFLTLECVKNVWVIYLRLKMVNFDPLLASQRYEQTLINLVQFGQPEPPDQQSLAPKAQVVGHLELRVDWQ